jgi:hypothetical protein
MAFSDNSAREILTSLEAVTNSARSNRDWDQVYQYILLHPNDFFVILPGRRWAIAHQVVYHGNVDLFKRIVLLFSADQINIHSKTNDGKTCLDIASEKRTVHPTMYTYIEHLFAQDELIDEAKQSNWRSVMDILDKNRQLANEKPPYSPYFLLHYVVENGDALILQELIDHFQVRTNVLNEKNETPLDMAMRLNRYDLCSILQSKMATRPHSQPQSNRSDERSTYDSPVNSFNEPTRSHPSSPVFSSKPCVPTTQSQGLFNSARGRPPPPSRQTGVQHIYTEKSIISEHPLTHSNPPVATSFDRSSMKHLICPITDELFVDPVIASDGYTYERAAILDWFNEYHKSPKTGAVINAIFRDNIEIKQAIQSIRREN